MVSNAFLVRACVRAVAALGLERNSQAAAQPQQLSQYTYCSVRQSPRNGLHHPRSLPERVRTEEQRAPESKIFLSV